MKTFLFAFFAFASLIAGGMSSPFDKEGTGLEARASKDYGSHKQAIQNLFQEVSLQTGALNKSINSASNSLMEEDRKSLAADLDAHVRGITQLLKQARTAKVSNGKRDTLDSREEACNEECIHNLVQALVNEIAYTINYIISKLGIEAVFDYLTPMVMALVQLLSYWDLSIVGLVISVREIVNGIFTSIGITIIAIVVKE